MILKSKEYFECKNFVGGTWKTTPHCFPIVSPFSEKEIGHAHEFSSEDLNILIRESSKGFSIWKNFSLDQRANILRNFRNLLEKNLDTFSNITSLESGKTPDEAKAGILKGIEIVDFCTSIPFMKLESSKDFGSGILCQERRVPLGITLGITPFNFPVMVPMWMIPIALMAGNAFILKPSEKVPISATILAQLLQEAGLPEGVFSLVHGNKKIVNELIARKEIKAVAFVGSTPVAKSIYQQSANSGKRVLALGGAKNHLVVSRHSNASDTIGPIIKSFIGCAGQRCMAGSVLITIGNSDDLISKIIKKLDSLSPIKDYGALIDKISLDRLNTTLKLSVTKPDEEIILDGSESIKKFDLKEGFWLSPTIIKVQKSSSLLKEELFGPVLSVLEVDTLDQAIEQLNSSEFGNAACLFTDNLNESEFFINNVSMGMVGINVSVPVPKNPFSFGGVNQSKFGANDITGIEGYHFWTDLKKITTRAKSTKLTEPSF